MNWNSSRFTSSLPQISVWWRESGLGPTGPLGPRLAKSVKPAGHPLPALGSGPAQAGTLMNADWLLTESDSMSGESWRLSSLRCAEPCSLRELMNVKVLVTESRLALCNTTDCSTPGSPVLHHFLEFAQTHVHWFCDAIQPSHPLSPPSPPAFNLYQHQGLFQWVDSFHPWPKDWSFSFSISPSNEYSVLISFRIDWFDFLAVQGTLRSFLQHHNSKALVLWCSALFRPYGPTLRWL